MATFPCGLSDAQFRASVSELVSDGRFSARGLTVQFSQVTAFSRARAGVRGNSRSRDGPPFTPVGLRFPARGMHTREPMNGSRQRTRYSRSN